MKRVLFTLLSFCALLSATSVAGQSIDRIEEMFMNPPQDSKPLIIWQWMDGLVTKESITADLEAFKAAGLGGVQNFQIGHQGLIGNPDILVGSPEWKELMVWTLQECARLGLSFGTHNCPGWSSSAAPDVLPEYSMQKLVWTETPASGTSVTLPQPETNLGWYKDIEVLAVPASGIVPMSSVIDLSSAMDANGCVSLESLPEGEWTVFRFGHTTNMQTNGATAPTSGTGLECDKFSREAIQRFWNGYPKMVLDLAGEYAGTTFTRIEIDSYEAGGQDWTVSFPQGWGAPDMIEIDKLMSWSESGIAGVKYFSGTATYRQEIQIPRKFLKGKGYSYILDLGEVKNMARVKINGEYISEVLWTAPFRVEAGPWLKPGKNIIEIDVTNLWPNRMIGDEQEPDDTEWAEPSRRTPGQDNSVLNVFMKEIPDWLKYNQPRPSSGRYTISSFKYFGADHPLFPAGLLGPEIVIRKIK